MSSPASVRRAEFKRLRYLRETGRPSYIRVGPETLRAHRKLASYHARGMSIPEMSRQTGLSGGALYRMVKRDDVGMLRSSVEKIAAMPFVRSEAGRIDATGSTRRIQALWYDGFTTVWIAGRLGVEIKHVYRMTHGKTRFVTVAMADRVREMYDDVAEKAPDDLGLPRRSQGLATLYAARRGFAPRRCWDPDTIDDPGARPEWTGRCGTVFGWRIHEQQKIPLCEPCSAARGTELPEFLPKLLAEARARRGLNLAELGRISGVNQATIQSWEAGRSRPRRGTDLEKVLSVLDVTFEEVTEPKEKNP